MEKIRLVLWQQESENITLLIITLSPAKMRIKTAYLVEK